MSYTLSFESDLDDLAHCRRSIAVQTMTSLTGVNVIQYYQSKSRSRLDLDIC